MKKRRNIPLDIGGKSSSCPYQSFWQSIFIFIWDKTMIIENVKSINHNIYCKASDSWGVSISIDGYGTHINGLDFKTAKEARQCAKSFASYIRDYLITITKTS